MLEIGSSIGILPGEETSERDSATTLNDEDVLEDIDVPENIDVGTAATVPANSDSDTSAFGFGLSLSAWNESDEENVPNGLITVTADESGGDIPEEFEKQLSEIKPEDLGVDVVDALGRQEGVSRREILHEVTQPTRFTLVQHILMHPQQMPSIAEFEFLNPDKSKSTIREHLDRLCEIGIIIVVPVEDIKRDLPRKYYTLTDLGREVLEEFDLLGLEKTLQYLYSRVEKPDRIKKIERLDRPDPDRGVIAN